MHFSLMCLLLTVAFHTCLLWKATVGTSNDLYPPSISSPLKKAFQLFCWCSATSSASLITSPTSAAAISFCSLTWHKGWPVWNHLGIWNTPFTLQLKPVMNLSLSPKRWNGMWCPFFSTEKEDIVYSNETYSFFWLPMYPFSIPLRRQESPYIGPSTIPWVPSGSQLILFRGSKPDLVATPSMPLPLVVSFSWCVATELA